MEETNQKNIKILIIFLSLLVLILAGYIAYDKITSNNRNQNNNEQVNKNNSKEENEDLSEITFGEEYENKEISIDEENEQLLYKIVGD